MNYAYIDEHGEACWYGPEPPEETRAERIARAREWWEKQSAEMRVVINVIRKFDRYADGHTRTMVLHAFYNLLHESKAVPGMPKKDALAKLAVEHPSLFQVACETYFKR